MSSYRTKKWWNERGEFINQLSKETDDKMSVDDMDRIIQIAHTHHHLAEVYCSVELTEKQEARREKREQNIEAEITRLCAPYGIVPKFQGDPRGCTVKLKLPSGRTNDWGQEGWCVP